MHLKTNDAKKSAIPKKEITPMNDPLRPFTTCIEKIEEFVYLPLLNWISKNQTKDVRINEYKINPKIPMPK